MSAAVTDAVIGRCHAGFPDGRKILLREAAPRAMAAQADCVGGVDRLKMAPEGLAWGGGTVANLCKDADEPWQPPRPELAGWHKDGWHVRVLQPTLHHVLP